MKKQIACLLIAAVVALSLATFQHVEPVEAYGEYVYVPRSGQAEFNRVYCYYWDGIWGIPEATVTYPQRAVISEGTYLRVPALGYTKAYLYRTIFVYRDGVYAYSGQISLNNQMGNFYWLPGTYYVQFTFYDDLYIKAYEPTNSPYSGLRFYFDTSPTQFAGYKWVVSYSMAIYSYYAYGEVCDAAWITFGDIVHDEYNTPYNWELCPECYARYANNVAWTSTYGQASVIQPSYALGSSPDGNAAQLWAYSNGAVAYAAYQLDGYAVGDVYLRVRAGNANSRLLVYVSEDNSNWILAGDTNLPQSGSFSWVNIGRPQTSRYRYVLAVAYNDGKISDVYIDCFRTGHPP
jgi:hypothetical protein